MGKTLGSIIAVGFAVGINVIPGVGTAISGAIVGAMGGTFASVGIAAGVVQAIQLGSLAYGLQAGASLLGLGPSIPKPDTAVTAIKTPRPPRVSGYGISRLYGASVLYETDSTGTAIDVFAIHDGKMSGAIQFYLGDDQITLSSGYPGGFVNAGADGRYSDNHISLYYTNGSSPGLVITPAVSRLPGIWTNNHRGDGVVMLYLFSAPVKSKKFLEVYPNQVPTPSIVAQWQLCPDPYHADPTNPAGWTWTENAVRQLMHYKIHREGVDYATKIAPAIAYWRAASDICNEAITLKAGGTEARYRSWLTHKHTDRHGEVTAALLSTFDGWIAPRSDGALVVYAGKYYTPTVSIGPEHITSYDWNGVGVDDDKAVNEIVCSYISADHDYSSVETDAWRNESDISARGQILSGNLDPQVPSWGQVRRLAKIKMARTNAIYSGTITTNAAGRIARGQRFINLRIADAGAVFYNGPAEITALTRNLMSGGVTFTWVAVDPNMYSWNPATEEGDPAAKGDRVAQEPLDAPTITDAEAELGDGGSTARIRITVDAPDRPDLTWYARWRVTTDTTWNEQEYGDIDAGPAVLLQTNLVPLDVSIDVEVAYQTGDGRLSPWSNQETVSTSTAALAPSAPTGVSGTGGAGDATILWTNSASPNLSYSRVYRNTTNTMTGATHVAGDQPSSAGAGQAYVDTVAAGSYYYFVRAYSASGASSVAIGTGLVTVT